MSRHVAEPGALTREQRLDALRQKVRRALQEYLEECRPNEGALILEWAAAVEWSNYEAEARRAAGRLVVCENDRISQSAIEGLGLHMAGLNR